MLRPLAIISAVAGFALVATSPVETARRPRYGGTLRVEIGASVATPDPATAASTAEESAAKEQIDGLICAGRNPDGTFAGAPGDGAFRVAAWEPGKHARLVANDDCRTGRPFVDSIEIQMGRSARDLLLDLELNKTDFAEISPEQARVAAQRGVRVSRSRPDELLALVFPGAAGDRKNDLRAREAIAGAVDRAAIVNFILQKEGQPAGGLLPQWSSGTAFLFSTASDPHGAKELWSQIAPSPRWVLGYDSADPLEKLIAERVVVNARESGISLQLKAIAGGAPDGNVNIRLIRLRMASPEPRAALAKSLEALAPMAGLDAEPLPAPASPQDIYDRERAALDGFRIVPLVWLPQVYGLSARVRDWTAPAAGETWPLADLWLEEEAAQ